jgi:hypothetical protein
MMGAGLPSACDGEVLGEALGVDGGAGDDHLEVGALRQQLLQVAEDEVDVEAALVGLVDDQRVVAASFRSRWISLSRMPSVITLTGSSRHLVGEAHRVADGRRRASSRARRRPARRRARGDCGGAACGRSCPSHAEAGLEAQLRQLRALARPGLPATITTWWSRIAASSSSRRSVIGRLSGYANRPPVTIASAAARRRSMEALDMAIRPFSLAAADPSPTAGSVELSHRAGST